MPSETAFDQQTPRHLTLLPVGCWTLVHLARCATLCAHQRVPTSRCMLAGSTDSMPQACSLPSSMLTMLLIAGLLRHVVSSICESATSLPCLLQVGQKAIEGIFDRLKMVSKHREQAKVPDTLKSPYETALRHLNVTAWPERVVARDPQKKTITDFVKSALKCECLVDRQFRSGTSTFCYRQLYAAAKPNLVITSAVTVPWYNNAAAYKRTICTGFVVVHMLLPGSTCHLLHC